MADLKISQLASATALAGTEVVPVVQSGATKKATIDQILAPASGKGINFSAAGGDTLTIYDEGTWTPSFTNLTTDSGTPAPTGTYTRIGRLVYFAIYIPSGHTTSVANSTYCTNLPVAASGNHVCAASNASTVDSYGNGLIQGVNVFPPSWVNKVNVIISGVYSV